jgi:hypothetical protein
MMDAVAQRGGRDASAASTEQRISDTLLLEVEARMRSPGSGLALCERRGIFRKTAKCFLASEAVDWMLSQMSEVVKTREEAVAIIQLLVERQIICGVSASDNHYQQGFVDNTLFRFLEDDQNVKVLNFRNAYRFDTPQDPVDVSVHLLSTLVALVREQSEISVSNDLSTPEDVSTTTTKNETDKLTEGEGGKEREENEKGRPAGNESDPKMAVDCYKRLRDHPKFLHFEQTTSELKRVNIRSLNKKGRMAFWINMYNALAVHACVRKGPVFQSALTRGSFFRGNAYNISGLIFTLDDIEHGILRGNRSPPSALAQSTYFKSDDPRVGLVMELDPRIHFLLSCASMGSPPIAFLTRDNVYAHLQAATRYSLAKHLSIDRLKTLITVPKVFDWYRRDFAEDMRGVIKWMYENLNGEMKRQMNSLSNFGYLTVKYGDYNWAPALPVLLQDVQDEEGKAVLACASSLGDLSPLSRKF